MARTRDFLDEWAEWYSLPETSTTAGAAAPALPSRFAPLPRSGSSWSTAQSGLAAIRFNQVDGATRGDGKRQAWEAGTGTQVGDGTVIRGQQRGELQGIRDVSMADVVRCRGGDQVDPRRPAHQEIEERLDLRLLASRKCGRFG